MKLIGFFMLEQYCKFVGILERKSPMYPAGYGVVNSFAVQTYLALLFFSHIITYGLTTS
jgi:hypothetical protein